jgi:hypothetical protein
MLTSRKDVTIAMILLGVALLWTISSWSYYALVDGLSLDSGYDDAPVLFTGFYLTWSAIALGLFRPVLAIHITARKLLGHVLALSPILLIYGFYVVVILPLLPNVSESRAPANPPEFMFASAWYYLPKSADILFQQTLIAAMVLGGYRARLSLITISIGMAVLFGGFHLMLIFDGFTRLYVARFTLAGALLGMVVPYLYLRTRYGFRWAYGLHWSFYALDAAVTHLFLAVPPWEV